MTTIQQEKDYRRTGNHPIIPTKSADINTPKEIDNFYRTGQEFELPLDDNEKIKKLQDTLPYNYKAFLSQSGTTAPIGNVLVNTINNLVWLRVSGGTYSLTKTGAFIEGKTVPISDNYLDVNGNKFTIERINNNTLILKTYLSTDLVNPADDVLNNQYFNIEIYK